MLTSFFNTSKPINTIIVVVYISVVYFVTNFEVVAEELFRFETLKIIGTWILYVLTVFVINFISQKNELARKSAFRLILFASITTAFPDALLHPEVIISGLLVLLGLRRILSLRSGLYMERKLFDTGFLLCLATLIFFYAHLFVIVLLVALLFYGRTSIRFWIIPWIAWISIGMLLVCYILAMNLDMTYFYSFVDDISFDFLNYSKLSLLIPITFFSSFLVWSIWSFLGEMQKAVIVQKPLYLIVIVTALVTIAIAVFSPDKSGKEWYFFAFPLAIIGSSFFENATNKWIPEVFLWMIVAIPILVQFV